RATSSIVYMRCRVATIIGCWLSATRSTANAQPRCSMYTLPAANAMAANPTANSANTARSSHTKYVCSETSTVRNIHIHFRLLSLVFIFFYIPQALPHGTSAAGLFPASSVALPLTWMHQLVRRVQPHPLYLSYLTASSPKMRWYTRYIFGPKRVS